MSCLERFDDVKVRVTYQKALQAEVLGFTESISQKVESGMKGEPLVQEVVHEWEDIVNRVTKSAVGEKTIVCGKSARWWDNAVGAKCIRRLLAVGKSYGLSIVDYVRKSRKQ